MQSGSVIIGYSSGVAGNYTLNDTASLAATGDGVSTGILYIGAAGTGDLNQSGGSITAASLSMGNNAGGSGTYELSAGSVTISGTSYLGAGPGITQGIVTQTGGTADLEGNVILGNYANAEGQYSPLGNSGASLTIGGNLDIAAATGSSGSFYFNYDNQTSTPGGNATLTFSAPSALMYVGDAGTGTFWQGGGDLDLTNHVTLDIGVNQGSNGTYNLVAGTLEDNQIVGDAGTGQFNNTGSSTHTVNGDLIIGNASTGVGIYTLGGNGNLKMATPAAEIILGNTTGAHGTFNYNTSPGDTGTITFGLGQEIVVGASGSGTFNQGGGNLNLNGAGVALEIAQNSGSTGAYNLSGGSLETLGGLKVGDGGTGTFDQSGGSASINGTLTIASQSTSIGSQYTLSNGTLTASALIVGDAGTAFYSRTGGTATINSNLTIGNQSGSSGDLTVGGAGNPSLTVTGNATVGNNGSGSFNEDAGGTIDIKGSMTIGNIGAASTNGQALISGGSLTVGDGGPANQLLITSNGSMAIQDTSGVGAQVTVDGLLVNNADLSLTPAVNDTVKATLTATGGFQNNGQFNFEGNSILDANVTNGLTNTAAYFTVQNGPGANVTLNGNMSNFATVNVSELSLVASTYTQNGTFTNNLGGTFQSTDGAITINGQASADSLDNSGTVTFANDSNGGTTPPYQPSVVNLNNNVTNASTGTINVKGSNVTVTATASSGNPAFDNFGKLNVTTGSNNQGSTFTVAGNTTNEAGGKITVSGSTTYWNGTFQNNGAYIRDPSTSHFINLDIGTTGYLQGGAGDVFDVAGAFLNQSADTTDWNTVLAELEFRGTGTHDLTSGAVDSGPVPPSADNFDWGTLDIDSGNIIDLLTDPLYVGSLDYAGSAFTASDLAALSGGFDLYTIRAITPTSTTRRTNLRAVDICVPLAPHLLARRHRALRLRCLSPAR